MSTFISTAPRQDPHSNWVTVTFMSNNCGGFNLGFFTNQFASNNNNNNNNKCKNLIVDHIANNY